MATGSIFIPSNARTLSVKVWAPGGTGGNGGNGSVRIDGESGGVSTVLGLTVNGGGGGSGSGGGGLGGTSSGGSINLTGNNGSAGQQSPPILGPGGTGVTPNSPTYSSGGNGSTGTYVVNEGTSQYQELYAGTKCSNQDYLVFFSNFCAAAGYSGFRVAGRAGDGSCGPGHSNYDGYCTRTVYNDNFVTYAGAGGGGGEGGYSEIIYTREQLQTLGWLNTTQNYTYSTSGMNNGLVLININTSNVHIKDSNSWSRVQDVYIKDGGAWKKVQKIYIKNNSGNWTNVL